jgi:hypothetical protein
MFGILRGLFPAKEVSFFSHTKTFVLSRWSYGTALVNTKVAVCSLGNNTQTTTLW